MKHWYTTSGLTGGQRLFGHASGGQGFFGVLQVGENTFFTDTDTAVGQKKLRSTHIFCPCLFVY